MTKTDNQKHEFPDPHWDEGCVKCGGFDGEPCEPPRGYVSKCNKPCSTVIAEKETSFKSILQEVWEKMPDDITTNDRFYSSQIEPHIKNALAAAKREGAIELLREVDTRMLEFRREKESIESAWNFLCFYIHDKIRFLKNNDQS